MGVPTGAAGFLPSSAACQAAGTAAFPAWQPQGSQRPASWAGAGRGPRAFGGRRLPTRLPASISWAYHAPAGVTSLFTFSTT